MKFKDFLTKKGLTQEDLAKKTAAELAELHNEFNEIANKALETAIENKASKDEVAILKAEIAKFEALKADELKAEVIRIAGELKALKEAPVKTEEKGMNLSQALFAAFMEKKDEIDAIVKSGKQTAPLSVTVNKVVGTMSVESTIGAGSTFNTITENTNIISPIRKREMTYLANVSVGSISNNRAVWVEETDEEGTPIMLGEGDAKTQLDVQYVEATMAVKKIAVYGKVTTELLADLPQLISYIQNNLTKRMDIVLESQLFGGNGVGDNIKGLTTYATAFSADALADTIVDANELDVMEAVALQVKLAFGNPNAIFVHPSTMAKIKLIKDDAGRPVWKDYVTIQGEMVISGMKVIETTAITAGEFVGGDLSVVNVLNREGLTITIGLDGNDFTQNKKTMLLERRLTQFVSGNDTGCIVDGVFADAIVDLDSVLT